MMLLTEMETVKWTCERCGKAYYLLLRVGVDDLFCVECWRKLGEPPPHPRRKEEAVSGSLLDREVGAPLKLERPPAGRSRCRRF